jgi:iron complex transport system permease protein
MGNASKKHRLIVVREAVIGAGPLFLFLAVLLGFAFVAGIAVGSAPVSAGTVLRVLALRILPDGWVDAAGISEADQVIVWIVRTPRVIVAAAVGASLAVAGTQIQGLFRNPLASPDLIGASAGGALGAVLAIASGLATRSLFYLPIISFVGALLALFLVYAIATRHGRTTIATLLLAGIAVNGICGAATSFLISATWVQFQVAQEMFLWLMGGLESRTWEHVGLILPCLALGLGLAVVHARDLDVMLLGEDAALAVGIVPEKVRFAVITGAALLTGGAVAVSGAVGFVGLVVPHVVRLVVGPRHRLLLPASALTGAALVIAADVLARTLVRPGEIRLGIITASLGSPFFLYLLLRQQRTSPYQ